MTLPVDPVEAAREFERQCLLNHRSVFVTLDPDREGYVRIDIQYHRGHTSCSIPRAEFEALFAAQDREREDRELKDLHRRASEAVR